MDPRSTCYMCEDAAVSHEHAPPKCFFPEAKDVGVDLRANLITVPSCETHNSLRSQDDEYAMMFVVSHYGTNAVAREQFATKCIRALKRSHRLTAEFFRESRPAQLGGKETRTVRVDRERFDRVMEHTCRALFLHEFNSKFTDRLFVWSPAFRYPNFEPDLQLSELGYLARQV